MSIDFSCPIGYYKPSKDEPVRHCVDFSGVADYVNLTPTLNKYREFRYNDSRKRISFLTQRNTFCLNPLTRKVISFDSNNKGFDIIFKTVNPHIKESSLLFYDFVDFSDERFSYNELYRFKNLRLLQNLEEVGTTTKNAGKLLLYGASGVLLYKLYSILTPIKTEPSK